MNQQSFDDIIKKKVEQFSAPVPPDAWDNIMGRKKRRRFVFFWWISGLLLAGTVSVMVYERLLPGKNNANDEIDSVYQSSINTEVVSVHQLAISKNNEADTAYQSLISNEFDSVHQLMTSKNIEADSVYQSSMGNIIDSVRQLMTSKNIEVDSVYQLSMSNEIDSVHQLLTSKNNEADNVYQSSINNVVVNNTNDKTDSANSIIEINPIWSYYLQTKIDYSISHVPVDTNQMKVAAKKSIWTIDLSITPFIPIQKNEALLYLQRIQSTNGYKTVYTADKIETSEEPSLAYSFAIKRKISKKLEIGAGLQYARIREKVWLSGRETNTTFSVIQRLHNDNTGPYLSDVTYQASTTGTRIINATNNYSTFSIPLFVQYEVMKQRRFSLYLNTGTYINVIRKYSNSIKGDFDVIYASGMQQGSHKTNLGVDIFAGLRLATTSAKKYRFFAEPNFRYSFMKNNTSDMINAKYLHQLGLSIGVSYSIN